MKAVARQERALAWARLEGSAAAIVGFLIVHVGMGVNWGTFVGIGGYALLRLGWELHRSKQSDDKRTVG